MGYVSKMEFRKTIIGILFDETMCRLKEETKRKKYVNTEIRKVSKKHYNISKKDPIAFNKAYKLASDAFVNAQKKFLGQGVEFSNVIKLKMLIQKEPWLVKYFKLNLKHFEQLEKSYSLDKHIFRTAKVTNALLKEIDVTLARYNYNKGK